MLRAAPESWSSDRYGSIRVVGIRVLIELVHNARPSSPPPPSRIRTRQPAPPRRPRSPQQRPLRAASAMAAVLPLGCLATSRALSVVPECCLNPQRRGRHAACLPPLLPVVQPSSGSTPGLAGSLGRSGRGEPHVATPAGSLVASKGTGLLLESKIRHQCSGYWVLSPLLAIGIVCLFRFTRITTSDV